MNLQTTTPQNLPGRFIASQMALRHAPDEVDADELTLVRMRTAREMAQVSSLREEIDLPASALADPGFRTLEKKETRRASWVRCNGAAPSSAR